APSAAMHAQLHEWLAISRANLGQPLGIVLDGFDQALALDPSNERIRRNRAVAESWLVKTVKAQPTWNIPTAESVSRLQQTHFDHRYSRRAVFNNVPQDQFAELLAAG